MQGLTFESAVDSLFSYPVRSKWLSRGRDEIYLASEKEIAMLWTIFVVLVILWLLGFSLHIGGGLIHILLVVGLIVLVLNLLSGRRALD